MAPRNIAVFGDTHGHLRLLFQLCRLWQRAHGIQLDGILQCGDFGFFPNRDALDRATRRYASSDPEELGFSRFFKKPEPEEQDQLLESTLRGNPQSLDTVVCAVHWCQGNHEDFQALQQVVQGRPRAAVDTFERLIWLQSGRAHRICDLQVAVIGGGRERTEGTPEEVGLDVPWGLIHDRVVEALIDQEFDVLLTHCGPNGVEGLVEQGGSDLLTLLVEETQPAYHFYAHHRGPVEPTNLGTTQCVWLNDVCFEKAGEGARPYRRLEAGCMGILNWTDDAEHSFHVVDEAWTRQITSSSWRRI